MRLELREKRFGGAPTLGPLTLEIGPGEVVALTGPSGIGKTTLMRIVAGLDPAFDGRLARPERLSMVFQAPTLLPWRSAADNLRLTTGVSAEEASALLAEVGLAGRDAAFPGQLSLGQQRRLALARALAAAPELLLLDEPFVSLDEETALRMRALTMDLIGRRGIAALMTTHDLAAAAAMADRVLSLQGSPARLAREARIATPRDQRSETREVERLRALLE